MNRINFILGISFFAFTLSNCTTNIRTGEFSSKAEPSDSLPLVLPLNKSDLIDRELRHEASVRFAEHQLPGTMKEWEEYKVKLRSEVVKKAGVAVDHKLPWLRRLLLCL